MLLYAGMGTYKGRSRTRLQQERHAGYKGIVTFQNCASQHLPKTPIGLHLPSADGQCIEPCRKVATGLSSAKVFVDPLHAASCGRYRNSGVRAQFSRASQSGGFPTQEGQ